MNDPAASSGVSSFLLSRHSVLDTESSRVFWIPAFAGMTNSRQAAGNEPEGIQDLFFYLLGHLNHRRLNPFMTNSNKNRNYTIDLGIFRYTPQIF